MKKAFTTILIFLTLASFGQQITLTQWNEQAASDIRLLPKYGNTPKTDGQKSADKEFIETTLKQYPDNRKASDHLIELGFKYLYKDIKTAMYRFNQAYLLDSTNTDIYWGYGAAYMTLGDLANARKQYLEGLAIDSQSTHLLTDYGTYFVSQYYALRPANEKNALLQLDSAINYMSRSYRIDSKDQNTTFKLSVCYFRKKDYENAWRYYDECRLLGGQPITENYSKALTEQCKIK